MDEELRAGAADQPDRGEYVDPLDDAPETTPNGSLVLTVAAFLLAAAALVQIPIVLGPLGMACGLVAHVKGRRAGFVAAVAAGITTVVGLSVQFLLVNPFE